VGIDELYRTFAEVFINARRGLNITQHASTSIRLSRFLLPSWVPDWTVRDERVTFNRTDYYGTRGRSTQDSVTLGVVLGTTDVQVHHVCLLKEVVTHRRPISDELSGQRLRTDEEYTYGHQNRAPTLEVSNELPWEAPP
jgi:hypothetical protein